MLALSVATQPTDQLTTDYNWWKSDQLTTDQLTNLRASMKVRNVIFAQPHSTFKTGGVMFVISLCHAMSLSLSFLQ